MRTERLTEPHKLGLERLTGGNRGLFYCNERTEQVPVPDGELADGQEATRQEWLYDVYEIPDARQHGKVKNSVITDQHPYGDEKKVLRKTLAALLRRMDLYDDDAFAEFRDYNDFAEQV